MMNENCGWRERASSAGLLILRLLMGAAIAHHGYQKVFGGQVVMLADGLVKMGLPAPHLLAWLAALSEFGGGLLIVLGLATRFGAFFVFFTMCVAFFGAHGHSFEKGGELAYMYGTVALSLIFTGSGCYALDSLCCRGKCKNKESEAS